MEQKGNKKSNNSHSFNLDMIIYGVAVYKIRKIARNTLIVFHPNLCIIIIYGGREFKIRQIDKNPLIVFHLI